MSKELIVSSTTHETKVAILEDDELVEVFFEREKQHGLAGSIYKGRVTRVLPGMQSAFVNIGLERDAFLYVSDFFEDNEEYDRIVTTVEDKIIKMAEKGPPAAEATSTERPDGDGAEVAPADRGSDSAEPVSATREPGLDRGPHRRGRRGRRRRMPGRGFPESKYASRVETPPPPPAPAPFSEVAVEEGADFEVLPGESLAKYSRSPQADEPPAPELEPLQEAASLEEFRLDALLEKTTPEPDAPDAESLEPSIEANESNAVEAPSQTTVESAAVSPEWTDEPAVADVEPSDRFPEGENFEQTSPEAEAQPLIEDAGEEGPPPSEQEATIEGEVSMRERPYGRRYLHRNARRTRRRGRDRRMPEREGNRVSAVAAAEEPASAPPRIEANITDLLKEGQEIIVQIAKEPIGKKGARITSHIALPGRYLVYMPTVDHVGVSRKIFSDEQRLRLKRIVQTHRIGMPGGFIVRTAGEGQSEEEIRSDMHFLYNLWLDMRQKAERRPAPALIHHDLNLVERILRDQLTETFKTIWVDAQEDYERILQFVERFQPGLVGRVKLYTRSNPIFDEFGITPELEKALRPKVWLKSGGYIVINQTEALVAIDVNTGKYVGKSNRLEDTIVKTNTDAVKEIVRQIRLRDLGGIIVVDFIDMDERKNRQKVMQALDEALRSDRAPSKILQFNDFGLVAITRKRVKQSLERMLCTSCPYCDGSGFVKSVHTMIQEILVEAKKIARTLEGRNVILRVNPEVAKALKSRENSYLEEIETMLGRPVLVKGDPQLHQERFDFN